MLRKMEMFHNAHHYLEYQTPLYHPSISQGTYSSQPFDAGRTIRMPHAQGQGSGSESGHDPKPQIQILQRGQDGQTYMPLLALGRNQSHSQHFYESSYFEERQPACPDHKAFYASPLAPKSFEHDRMPEKQQQRSFKLEQQGSPTNSNLSVNIDQESDFSWDNKFNTPSFSDVTASAISASLNCGSPVETEFVIGRSSHSDASSRGYSGSRKSSHDSSCDGPPRVSSTGRFGASFIDSINGSPESINGFAAKPNTAGSLNLAMPSLTKVEFPVAINRNSTFASLSPGSPEVLMSRESRMHAGHCRAPQGQASPYVLSDSTALHASHTFPDFLMSPKSDSGEQYHSNSAHQPPFYTSEGTAVRSHTNSARSIAHGAPWFVPHLESSASPAEFKEHFQQGDRPRGLQAHSTDFQSQQHQRETNPGWMLRENDSNLLEDLSEIFCTPPAANSGVADLNVSPQNLVVVDDSRDEGLWPPSSGGSRDNKNTPSLRQVLAANIHSTNSSKDGPFPDGSFGARSPPSIGPLKFDDRKPSRPGTTNDGDLPTLISGNLSWAERMGLKADEYEPCASGENHCSEGWASLHKILDPSWEPNSISPNDVTSAVTYILQKRPEAECFPTAMEIFDSSYKIMKASRVNTAGVRKDMRASPTSVAACDLERVLGGDGQEEADGYELEPAMFLDIVSGASLKKQTKKRPSALPPCRVCGCSASGLHYGVVTCEACNGFFRRSLKRRVVYFCSKNNKCDVIGKRRGECSYCRYHKCLAVGMSRTAVKTGRYSDKTRLAYALESESRPKGGHSGQNSSSHGLLPFNLRKPSADFESFERELQSGSGVEDDQAGGADDAMDTDGLEQSRRDRGGSLSLSGSGGTRRLIMSSFVEMWLCNFIKFVRKVPGFSLLHIADQTALLQENWQQIWLLSSYRGRCEAEPSSRAGMTNPAVTYNEEKVVFGPRYADLSEVWYQHLRALEITQTEMVFLIMVCLTSPESGQLERKSQVGRLHWLMQQALSKHMDKLRVGAAESFPKALTTLLSMKSDLGQSSLLAFSVDQLVLENAQCGLDRPLLTEMMRPARLKPPVEIVSS